MTALAHLNLNDEYLPYKYIIGQVILDVRAYVRIFAASSDQPGTEKQGHKDSGEQAQHYRHKIQILQDGVTRRGTKLCRGAREFYRHCQVPTANNNVQFIVARIKLRVCVRFYQGILELPTAHGTR